MKKLVYSPRYKVKLSGIRRYLDIQFGVDVRKKALRAITDHLHQLQEHENSGISLRELYGIDSDYRYVFVAHNYVFYRVTSDSIQILNIYNEREDFMLDLLGISSINEDAETYWDEVDRGKHSKDYER